MSSSYCPSFFKFFIYELNKDEMQVPRVFTSGVEGDGLPEKVHIIDGANNDWLVNTARDDSDWLFRGDGWINFVEDYLMVSGDAMVLKKIRDDLFAVTVFGSSTMEKTAIQRMSTTAEEPEENIYEIDNIDYDSGSEYCGGEDEDEPEEEGYEYGGLDEEQMESEDIYVPCQVLSGFVAREPRMTPKYYAREIFESGLAETPHHPYFIARIRGRRKADLFIPKHLVKDHSINLEQEIWLVDPMGKKYRAKTKKWKDGRMIVAGGWSSLCRVNYIEKDDRCICEIVQKKKEGVFIYVRIVRGYARKPSY